MPGIPLPSSLAAYKRVVGADPAANAEATVTVPVAANEVQTITGTPSGTFGLQIGGESGPATLTTTATAAAVQAYLRAFQSLGADGVTCSGGPLATTINVTFNGANTSFKDMPPLAVTGGTTGLTFATTTPGTSGKSWWLVTVMLTLVQGATQTPQPILILDDGATSYFESYGSTAAQAVSTTCVYVWAQGLGLTGQIGSGAAVHSSASIPNQLILPPGHRIRTNMIGLGANSDYGVPSCYVIELG